MKRALATAVLFTFALRAQMTLLKVVPARIRRLPILCSFGFACIVDPKIGQETGHAKPSFLSRCFPFSSLFLAVGALFIPLTGAQMIARVPMHEVSGEEIVRVSINGTGPYDFILDTGTDITMVERKLLRKLSISGGQSVTLVTALGASQHQRATAESIAIAGLSVERIKINTLEGVELGAIKGRVQGILGENFLKCFDVLIDNEQQTLTLDRTSRLVDTLAGEHLQLSRFGNFNYAPTPDRIVVKLRMPLLFQKSLLFLVDSGTSTAMFYPPPGSLALRAMRSSQQVNLNDVKSHNCQIQKTTLEIGSGTFRGIELAACEGITRNNMDTDGVLPTRIFNKFFISYRAGYVIANPHQADKAGRYD